MAMAMAMAVAGEKAQRLPKREETDGKYQWQLEDIYNTDALWEEDFKKVKELAAGMGKYQGTLGQSGARLLECLRYSDELFSLNDKVFIYARMRKDEDNANGKYQELADRAMTLGTEVYASGAYVVPEIISIEETTLRRYMSGEAGLAIYRQYLEEILRQKRHVLSRQEEELLAHASEVMHAPSEIFGMFNNADIRFPVVKDETGEEVELTKGRYAKFLESRDRRVREDAFRNLYATYGKSRNTLASMLGSNIKKDRFSASVRKYSSCLEAALDGDNIATDVYVKLIDTVNSNLHLLHRYLKLRRQALKLDELHMYDLYVPLVDEPRKTIPYEDALRTVEKGLAPLGETYVSDLKRAFASRWIDVYENEGKTSGAYSWGAYKTHPYVLLNYQGTINDVFTIAHEMGHAMHSYYTVKNQPYINSEYRIFVAEVASTVNESLLIRYLLDRTHEPAERAYLVNHYLEEFRGTIIRQVMFAEFEKETHEKAEAGSPMTHAGFSAAYRALNEKYFGGEVVIDQEIDLEWARIPHFYRSFYVYKYATGFSAATSLARQILEEGAPAVGRYLEFLGSGSSDYPLELLKKAGVDLTTPRPVEDAFKLFGKLLTELEGLLLSK